MEGLMTPQRLLIGWREWVRIPALNLHGIQAKVDTGARTSALHADTIEPFMVGDKSMVRFIVHPVRQRLDISVRCEASAVGRRVVTDSGGKGEERWVISVPIFLGETQIMTEITLTNRAAMSYRMLLGRSALNTCLIDPSHSYLMPKPKDVLRRYLQPRTTT